MGQPAIAQALEDQPPIFAAGVPVRDVVEFVGRLVERIERARVQQQRTKGTKP